MRNLNEDTLLGNCIFCKLKVYNNDGWRNIVSTVIEGKWICGECLVALESATKKAKKEYSKQAYTTKKDKVENTYNVTVDPTTGKLKRESFK